MYVGEECMIQSFLHEDREINSPIDLSVYLNGLSVQLLLLRKDIVQQENYVIIVFLIIN